MHEVPFLRSGAGETPAEGGCIMQVVDWISTGGWTDWPLCVWAPLREYAIEANDESTREQRQRLLDLIPRMMGTAMAAVPYSHDELQRKVESAYFDACDDDNYEPITPLTAALDKFDELTGHTPAKDPLDLTGVCAVLPDAHKRVKTPA